MSNHVSIAIDIDGAPPFALPNEPDETLASLYVKLGTVTIHFMSDDPRRLYELGRLLIDEATRAQTAQVKREKRDLGVCSVCRREQGTTYHQHPCE